MRSNRFKKSLSVFLSLVMMLGTLPLFGAIANAETDTTPVHPDAYLLGKYFSNDWVWYDAATGQNRLSWKVNGYPEYQNGMVSLNNLYLQISTPRLFEGVSADTGITFSYTYTPQIGDWHRHILSLGATEFTGSSNAPSHLYVSATNSWLNRDAGNIWTVPVIGYVDSSGTEHIQAMPASNAPYFEIGQTYDICVTISAEDGIQYNINGNDYDAIYFNSSFDEQKQYIKAFLNSVAGYQYNYIGVSRWNDGYFTGEIKDLCIYGKAFSKAELDNVTLPSGFAAVARTSFDVDQLSTANAQFNAVPAHQGDPMTDAYSNYVYADWTAWSGDGFNDVGYAVGRTSFKFAVPENNVLVYDGVHDVIAPVTLESWSNDTGGQSQIIKYVADNADQFDLMQNWQGYSSTWNVWAKNNINTAESFSHLRDTDPESPATQRDGASRFWWNKLQYNGSGNTLTYFTADYNINYHAKTAYRNSASTSHNFREDDVTSKSHYYVINYQPIYNILSEAATFYNTKIAGQEWKYTDASLDQAMSALYLIQLANPNHYSYSDVKGDVQKCASAIKLALREYSQINLVKKTGTVTFKQWTGEVFQTRIAYYGNIFTVPAVPAKAPIAQYEFTDPHWTPDITAGASYVMSDDYAGKIYTAAYTYTLRSYEITWLYTTEAGTQSASTTVPYGETPVAPEIAEGNYQTAERVYTFSNWSPDVVAVTGTAAYTAQYTDVARTYEVRFFDLNGDQIGATQNIAYGAAASAPALPTKAPDAEYHYTVSWDKAFNSITDNTNVYAVAAEEAHFGGTATCTEQAKCETCQTEYGEVDPNNHSFTAQVAEADYLVSGATCNSKAVYYKSCTRCGEAGTETFESGEYDATNHADLKPVSANPATCTEPGNNAYYACSACGNSYTDAEGTVLASEEDIVIEALGHSWSVTWTWDDSVTPPTAQAAFVCARDPEHNTTVNAEVAEIASTAAHCGEEGSVTYRASYTMDGVSYTTEGGNDKVITTSSLPHLWKEASWIWNADHSAVTLELVCERDENHTHQIPDIAAVEVPVSAADCTHNAVVKYTASATYDGYTFETETDNITVEGTALGHSYAFVDWTWAADYASATANFRCTRDNCTHTTAVTDLEIETTTVRNADCKYDQVVTYTAGVEFALTEGTAPTEYTDTTNQITLTGTKTAHDWGEINYVWAADNSTVTATRVCRNYASHAETETAAAEYTVPTAPTYTAAGEGLYTAVFENTAFGTKTKPVEIDPLKTQIEEALEASGSDIADIDALIAEAKKLVNGEDPYTATYEAGYISGLAGKVAAFEADQNDPSKVETLAGTLTEIKTLVDTHEDHIVYTVTYTLNGGSATNPTSFVRTDAAFTLTNPTRSGYVFAGWTGTGLTEATMEVTVDPASAENKSFTATWTVDNSEAEAAINNAAALIEDADDEYEDAYSEGLAGLVSSLEEALAADPQDPDAIRGLIDQVNAAIAAAANNQHSFTVLVTYDVEGGVTCTASGNALYQCANCTATKILTVPALGHDWGEWTVVTMPDFGVDGQDQRVCARCGETETRTTTISTAADKIIKFNNISKMYYVLDVDEGFNIYNSGSVYWYSTAPLNFHIYIYTNAGYDAVTVYLNGQVLAPNADGTYTIPAHAGDDTISVSAGSSASGSSSSGTCAYCGQTHPNTLWGRLIALFHAIFAFFRDLFKK